MIVTNHDSADFFAAASARSNLAIVSDGVEILGFPEIKGHQGKERRALASRDHRSTLL